LVILTAIVLVQLEMTITLLLVFVMGLGMMVLKQFGEMRIKLEALVDERTEELRMKSLELERQATHDTLTGLFNRCYADNYLNKEIESSKRNDRPCTIALADIDHFKQINDQHSHAVGDKFLCRIAGKRMSSRVTVVKSSCCVFRIQTQYSPNKFARR